LGTLVLLLFDNSRSYLFSRVSACVGLPRFGVVCAATTMSSLLKCARTWCAVCLRWRYLKDPFSPAEVHPTVTQRRSPPPSPEGVKEERESRVHRLDGRTEPRGCNVCGGGSTLALVYEGWAGGGDRGRLTGAGMPVCQVMSGVLFCGCGCASTLLLGRIVLWTRRRCKQHV